MRLRTAVAGAALVGAAGLAYARVEAASYRLRRVDLAILPPGHPDLRLLHLSDLHMTPNRRRLRAWLGSLAELRPDLVVVTGDFLAHDEAVPIVLDALEPLLDLPGAFVLGSNDYYAPHLINPFGYFTGPSDLREDRPQLPWPDLIAGLTAAGWADLGNARASLTADGRRIDLRGVDDPHIERDDYAVVAGAVDPAADLSLGVAHAPYLRVLDAMADDRVDLILAGHTHGGQVRVPGIGALVTNCDLDRRRSRGASEHRGVPLHVSAGLGTSPYAPIRFACPPEATLIVARSRG